MRILILALLVLVSSSIKTHFVENDDEWIYIFDGETFNGWHQYNSDSVGSQWSIENGELVFTDNDERLQDLLTDKEYTNFELSIEWNISKGGNSGIFYFASESQSYIWQSAPEMQVLDNDNHPDGKNPLTSAGSLFALIAPNNGKTKSVGKYNKAKIKVLKNRVEHWLNGVKILEYVYQSNAMWELVDKSKFKDMPYFGKSTTGHIGLQHHGEEVWYRNIRIRKL